MGNISKFDFGSDKDNGGWQVVDDRVMGGLSDGSIIFDEDAVIFKGVLSLDNNGGFSWAQLRLNHELSGSEDKIKIRIKTDHHKYSITMKIYNERGYHYESRPISTNSAWEEIELNTSDMIKTWRGRTFDEYLDFAASAYEFGVILKDKVEGEFAAELDYISLY